MPSGNSGDGSDRKSAKQFPLTGLLLDGARAGNEIRRLIRDSDAPIDICSAYLRSDALIHLLDGWRGVSGSRILVRWRLGDLLYGASDFQAFQVGENLGIDFFMRLDFHGKVYSMPPAGLILGSANLTLSGMGISDRSNQEVCTFADCRPENLAVVRALFQGATKVDRALLAALVKEAESVDPTTVEAQWSAGIRRCLTTTIGDRRLFVDECFMTSADWLGMSRTQFTDDTLHDVALLGLNPANLNRSIRGDSLQQGLRDTAVFRWLVSTLLVNGRSAYFGELTSRLHDTLLDDPAPRRTAVKDLLQNLLSWITTLEISEILVDRPNFSQRVRLVDQSSE